MAARWVAMLASVCCSRIMSDFFGGFGLDDDDMVAITAAILASMSKTVSVFVIDLVVTLSTDLVVALSMDFVFVNVLDFCEDCM